MEIMCCTKFLCCLNLTSVILWYVGLQQLIERQLVEKHHRCDNSQNVQLIKTTSHGIDNSRIRQHIDILIDTTGI